MARLGTVARIAGVVFDVRFPAGDLPGTHQALLIQHDRGPDVTLEVHEHIDPGTVRTIALGSTIGLRRG